MFRLHRPGPWSPLLAAIGLVPLALAVLAGGGPSAGTAAALEKSSTPGAAAGLGQALSPSTPEQIALVEHLLEQRAVFYGAWWCPHCFYQKNLFGTEAGERLPYVECARDEAGRNRCQAAEVKAYPTWVLNGETREGVQTLEELKTWSGFSGVKP